ncbi:MAG: aminodeoxychorismate lyase [Acidiferrobacterales bacterium]
MTPIPGVLVNGEAGDRLSIRDRGFQYGDGVFETIAVHHSKPLLWARHVARLHHGCARLQINVATDDYRLREEVDRLCTGVSRAVLKIVITRGESGRGYRSPRNVTPTRVMSLAEWPDYPPKNAVTGVNVRICRTRMSRNPQLAGIKHLNRLEQVLARSEWQDEFDEGLMLDEDNRIVEGTMSNVFLVSQGTLLTPDLSESGVAGVMRETVMDHANALSLPCRVTRVAREALGNADEIFLTNSLIGIWPVRQAESKGYSVGEITRCLQREIKGSHCFGETD